MIIQQCTYIQHGRAMFVLYLNDDTYSSDIIELSDSKSVIEWKYGVSKKVAKAYSIKSDYQVGRFDSVEIKPTPSDFFMYRSKHGIQRGGGMAAVIEFNDYFRKTFLTSSVK